MNLTVRNSAIKLSGFNNASLLLLFLFSTFPTTGLAQSINDDLAPKKTVKKTSTSAKPVRAPKPKKSAAKKSALIDEDPVRTAPAAAQTPAQTPVQTSTQKPTQVSTQTPMQTSAQKSTQTPGQILDRFMNFQQSAGVSVQDWNSLVAQTGTALQANPNDAPTKAQFFIGQGQLAFNRDDFSNALIQFNGAAQALPESALPMYCIGKVYLATKQPVEAQKAFEKAVKLNKGFALAYQGLGDAFTAQKKTRSAQDYYKQAAKVGLNSGAVVAGTPPANVEASSFAGTGGPSRPLQSNTTTSAPVDSFYDTELKTARSLTARKKWQESQNKLIALSKSNANPDVYIAIGDNYFGMRQWLSAQQAYRKATEINPNMALGYYKTGTAMYQMNEFQAASEALEKSLILDQNGATINRTNARKLADDASEKAKNLREGKKGKKLLIF